MKKVLYTLIVAGFLAVVLAGCGADEPSASRADEVANIVAAINQETEPTVLCHSDEAIVFTNQELTASEDLVGVIYVHEDLQIAAGYVYFQRSYIVFEDQANPGWQYTPIGGAYRFSFDGVLRDNAAELCSGLLDYYVQTIEEGFGRPVPS